MKALLGSLVILSFVFLSPSISSSIDRISVVFEEYVNLNDPWKLKMNSLGISPINYVKLTRSRSHVVVEYCRSYPKQRHRCTNTNDPRFSIKETPPYFVSLELYLKNVGAQDSAHYSLAVKYGTSGEDTRTFNVYTLQKPEIIKLDSIIGISMNEGNEMNIVCRVDCGLPSGLYHLEIFNNATKRWVDFRTSDDSVIRPGRFQPAIMERRISNEYFVREFTQVRCRVSNKVGTAEKRLTLEAKGKLDYLNSAGPLIVACSVPNPPLRKGLSLECTQSKNASWPPVYVQSEGYRSKVGLYTALLEGTKEKYTDLDEGTYTCFVEKGVIQLCTRRIQGNFRNIPKVMILSRVPAHENEIFVFLCVIPSVFQLKTFTLRGQLQSASWDVKDDRRYNLITKPSNTFKFRVAMKCKDMLVTCRLESDDDVKTSKVYVPIFCHLVGTLRFDPPRYEEPAPLMSKLRAVGLSDPQMALTYVWDRVLRPYEIYTDPGPNLITDGNVLTIPNSYKYRGVRYNYRCFAYKRVGRKNLASNVIEISFYTAMCSFKPRMDILFGIYTNMNPHCSLRNTKETWFELFYKPFISDMLLSLPISAKYTRVAIFPTTDSKIRSPELRRMRTFAIGFNESHQGREHLERLFRNNLYRLNATSPHVTSARSCELNSFQMVENRLSEFRPNVTQIFLYSLDLYDHHVRKKVLFSSISKDSHSYVMKSLSKSVLSRSYTYYSNLLYLSNLTRHTVNEIWFHYGSHCPGVSCPHLAVAKIIGVHFSFLLLPQTSPMFNYDFERQWFPLKKYSYGDHESIKCFIRKSMSGLRIQRIPTFKRICEASKSRMEPNIIEVYTVMADNCIWNSNQIATCRAMLGKPAGKLTISYRTSSTADWHSAPVKLENKAPPELNGNIFVTATAKLFVPKDHTSLHLSCRVVNSWHEDQKNVTYPCVKPKRAGVILETHPSAITEDDSANIICYTENWFVGKLCLQTGWGEVIQCKSTESDASSTGKLSIVYKIPAVRANMDNERYICSAQNIPLNTTENATTIFRVKRAKVRDTKVEFVTGPTYKDQSILEDKILVGYWFTVKCSSLVGSVRNMGSSLTLSRYHRGHLDVSFINSEEGCAKDPPKVLPTILYKCRKVEKHKGNADLMEISVTIKSSKIIHDEDEYKCLARNSMSKSGKNITVKVLSKPTIIEFEYQKVSSTVLLYCDVGCVPKPKVKIETLEESRRMKTGTTIPLTEIRPGVCRFRYFFNIADGMTYLARLRCTDSANFLGKKVTVTKDLVVFIKPAIFPPPTLAPDPPKEHEEFTVDCKFSALHLRLASSVLLFKNVAFANSKSNLPCMVYKKTYQTVTGIWKMREASVILDGEHIRFKLKSISVKDAGSYCCQAFYDSGNSAWTRLGTLSKIVMRPRVHGIYFYGYGSGDKQVQREKTKVLLGCQVNLGNKNVALETNIDFKAKGASITGLVTKTASQKDGTKVRTLYVIKPSLSYTFHNASFSCIASDDAGTSSSKSRALYVRYYPIHQTIKPKKTRVKDGEVLTCSADGYPQVAYLWTWVEGAARITSVGPLLSVSKLPRGSLEVACTVQNDGRPSISIKRKSVIVDDGRSFFLSAQPPQPVLGKRLALECPFHSTLPSAVVEWFRREGGRHVLIAEWTPSTFRLAPPLTRRNISVDMGDKGQRLVFNKARLEDSGAYRCRYQDATASGFRATSGIDADSNGKLCVRSPPKCEIQLEPSKPCYAEHETVTLITTAQAELNGCDRGDAPDERYFVVFMRPKRKAEAEGRLFSRAGYLRLGGRSEMDVAMDAKLDRQRLFCAVADLADEAGAGGGERRAVAPFAAAEARLDLCVRHAARVTVISHRARNDSGATRIQCDAAGNPWPMVHLTARGPAGWNLSARGMRRAQLTAPRDTRGRVLVNCVAKNYVAGKEHVFSSSGAIQIGAQVETSSTMAKTKVAITVFLSAGAFFMTVGVGAVTYWRLRRSNIARLRMGSLLLPNEVVHDDSE